MIFNSAWFWPFLAITLILLRLAPHSARGWVALALCAVFHFHYAGSAGMLPVMAIAASVFWLGRNPRKRLRAAAAIGVAISAIALVYFKYLGYFGTLLHLDWKLGAIPLGISFFTFEFVHYLIEVARGGKPIASIREFGLFTIFFPSLVAGPIKRYPDFVAQARKQDAFRPSPEGVLEGTTRILIGAAKKIVLADPLAALTESLHSEFLSQGLGAGQSWLLLVALALRIYFDFSGYSDMAIGAARTLNITLPENFNWPYAARSIQDFWRRWHISLSSWIRDYVYIPLGGARVGPIRRFTNFILAFALCGLWHGADTHFVAWGLWHGFGIGLERAVTATPAGGRVMEGAAGRVITLLFVGLGWLLFFYPVNEAARIALGLIGAPKGWGGA